MSFASLITGIAHVGIRVHDLGRARAFYQRLGFEFVIGPVGPEPVAILIHPSGVEVIQRESAKRWCNPLNKVQSGTQSPGPSSTASLRSFRRFGLLSPVEPDQIEAQNGLHRGKGGQTGLLLFREE